MKHWNKAFAKRILIYTAAVMVTAAPSVTYAHIVLPDGASLAGMDTVRREAHWIANPERYAVTASLQPNLHVHVPILEYHQAEYIPGNVLGLRPGQFAQEAEWLYQHGYHTINFGQLYAAFYRGYSLPDKPVLITFDDGYESVYDKVFKVLQTYHFQATIFMISSYVGLHGAWRMLEKNQLLAMEKSGLIDVESHTVTHPNLAVASPALATREIGQSAVDLERMMGHPIRFMCYPSGRYQASTIDILKRQGYLLATTQGHEQARLAQGPYALHRIVIYQTTSLSSFAHDLQSGRISH